LGYFVVCFRRESCKERS